jgi:membrane fusion protein (multidrug efflux system)
MNRRNLVAPAILIGAVVATGTALAAWKQASLERADAAAATQPEPVESVALAVAKARQHSPSTTSIGTVVALRSITVRNELSGTVRQVSLIPGRIVEAGDVLVALDVSVEKAELEALQAQAELAKTQLARIERMVQQRAASEMELDAARAERDVAVAQVARTLAVIERKTIRAPFRARVGLSDVHPGQYLNEGTVLTTLQGVDDHAYVDFAVAQQVAAQLKPGDRVEVRSASASSLTAAIVALDARVDSATRNATVRAQVTDGVDALTPGSSVRVRVPVGSPRMAVAIPASSVRKGPEGDHVFVLESDSSGVTRARMRRVQVETTVGDEVLLEEGVSDGERVAASGSFKLRDSALVAVIRQPPTVAAVDPARAQERAVEALAKAGEG